MPELVLKKTGEPIAVAPENLARALASGLYEQPAGGAVTQVSTPTGLADVPIAQAATSMDPLATTDRLAGAEHGAYLENHHGGLAGAAGTFVEQAADTATFGGYGLASDLVAGDDYTQNRAERLEANPTAGTAGTIVGAVAPALAGDVAGIGGAVARATPAGAAARVAESIVAKGAGRGIFAETAAAAAGYGVEGALYGSGHVLAESVLHDKPLSAEAFVAGAKEGAAWGALSGAGGSLLSRGTRFAKGKLEDVMQSRKDVATLAIEQKAAAKEAEAAQKQLAKSKLEQERHLNRKGMEELRQDGRLKLVEARSGAKLDALDASTAAKKDVLEASTAAKKDLTGYTAEQKLKLEEYRLSGKKDLAEIGNEARLKIANKAHEKAVAQAEARVAVAHAKLDGISEQLAVQQERTARAKLVMDGRLEIADTYTGGWKRAAESREAVAASKLEAASIGADARTRVGMADALVRSGRQDAGVLIEDMIEARLRTPKAMEAARGEAVLQAARMQSTTESLVQQADELMAMNPGAIDELKAARDAAAESSPAIEAWSQKATVGGDDFAEGFRTVRGAEQAQHDLAQVMKAHIEASGVPAPQFDDITAGMDAAVAKTDEITHQAMAKQIDAAAGAANGNVPAGADASSAAGIADMLLGAAGLPNADDIPVIGPVLGAYLKFRAIHGAIGKLGIRLPGPVGRIAQIGARVQNQATEVVSAIVTHAPAAVRTIERAAPSLASTLGRPIWDPHDEPATKGKANAYDPLKLYKRRVEELDRAMGDPEGTRKKIIDAIPAPPSVAEPVADTRMKQMEYLHGLVSTDPRAPTVTGKRPEPNRVEVQRFAEAKRAVENPIESIKDFIDGHIGPAAVDAVKAVFPRLFQSMQEQLIEAVSAVDSTIAFPRLVRAALVFDLPLSNATTPRYGFARQDEYAQADTQAQQPSPGGAQLRLSKQDELGSITRAMR